MTNEVVQMGFDFDYALVSEEHRLEAYSNAEIINAGAKQVADGMVEIGQRLIRQQELLKQENEGKHGLFEEWIEKGCILKRTTVFRFMSIARKSEALLQKVPHAGLFSPSTIDELLSASDEVIEQVTANNHTPTRDEVREAKQAEREALERVTQAKEAQRQAEEKVATTQQQLSMFSQLSQDKIKELTKQIETLQEQIKTIATPEAIEVTPPSVLAQIETMKANITKLTEQKKLLSDEATKLANSLDSERKANKAQQKQERYEAQVKGEWKKATDAIFKALSQFNGQLPSPIDLQVFDAEEWARYAKIEEALRYTLAMHVKLRKASDTQVIDNSPVYETSLMEING